MHTDFDSVQVPTGKAQGLTSKGSRFLSGKPRIFFKGKGGFLPSGEGDKEDWYFHTSADFCRRQVPSSLGLPLHTSAGSETVSTGTTTYQYQFANIGTGPVPILRNTHYAPQQFGSTNSELVLIGTSTSTDNDKFIPVRRDVDPHKV